MDIKDEDDFPELENPDKLMKFMPKKGTKRKKDIEKSIVISDEDQIWINIPQRIDQGDIASAEIELSKIVELLKYGNFKYSLFFETHHIIPKLLEIFTPVTPLSLITLTLFFLMMHNYPEKIPIFLDFDIIGFLSANLFATQLTDEEITQMIGICYEIARFSSESLNMITIILDFSGLFTFLVSHSSNKQMVTLILNLIIEILKTENVSEQTFHSCFEIFKYAESKFKSGMLENFVWDIHKYLSFCPELVDYYTDNDPELEKLLSLIPNCTAKRLGDITVIISNLLYNDFPPTRNIINYFPNIFNTAFLEYTFKPGAQIIKSMMEKDFIGPDEVNLGFFISNVNTGLYQNKEEAFSTVCAILQQWPDIIYNALECDVLDAIINMISDGKSSNNIIEALNLLRMIMQIHRKFTQTNKVFEEFAARDGLDFLEEMIDDVDEETSNFIQQFIAENTQNS